MQPAASGINFFLFAPLCCFRLQVDGGAAVFTQGLACCSSDLTDLPRATARQITHEISRQQETSEITDSLFLEYDPQSTDLLTNTSVFERSPLN